MLYRAHRVALDPNNVQRTQLSRSAGVSRFTYNWALEHWGNQERLRQSNLAIPQPSVTFLQSELRQIRHAHFPWMEEVAVCIPFQAINDLGRAYARYRAGKARAPVFHKKGMHDSFCIPQGLYKLNKTHIHLPRIGWIRMREEIRFPQASLFSVTISRDADRWFASFLCRIKQTSRRATADASRNTIGVDVGVHEFVCSDGTRYQVPRSYRNTEEALRRAQKSLSRKEKGSQNYTKQQMKIARLHRRAANIRKDWLHKTSAQIVAKNATIVIEDLDVAGMLKKKYLAKSIADASFGEFARQIKYKAEEVGHVVIVADRYFPSTKLCSECGCQVAHIDLNQRTWICSHCGATHDRDLNAAINLAKYAASTAVSACGELKTTGTTPRRTGSPR